VLSIVILVNSIGSVAITVGCLSRTAKPSGFLSRVTSVVVNSLIFVDSDYQGKGYGRKIIETLEKDEYFLRAERIEIPASMSAIPFYRKMGYEHKNGELIYEDGHFALEKFNRK
jgi:GNAT superfamily N-acetyltransferase